MAYIIKLTYNKPNICSWFSQTNEMIHSSNSDVATTPAQEMISFMKWCRDQAGYIGNITTPINRNVVTIAYVFDNEVNALMWNEARKLHPYQIAQELYFRKVGISATEEML